MHGQYNHPGYNLFTDNKNLISNDVGLNNKFRMVFHRDNHRRKLYLNLQKQELIAGAECTVCKKKLRRLMTTLVEPWASKTSIESLKVST